MTLWKRYCLLISQVIDYVGIMFRLPYTTQARLARLAGVSPAAVSMAMSGKGTLSPKTRSRILEIAKLMNYGPLASGERGRRHVIDEFPRRSIGFLAEFSGVGNFHLNSYYTRILGGITHACSRLNVCLVPLSAQRLATIAPESLCVDGVVIFFKETWEVIRRTPLAHRPMVSVVKEFPGLACIRSDEARVVGMAIDYLYEKGHRHISYAGPFYGPIAERRQESYRHHLKRLSLSPDRGEIYMTSHDYYQAGRGVATDLAYWKSYPHAIVIYNDMMALGLLQGCLERKIRVPEDLSIVSIDGIVEGQYSFPPLTTVSINGDQMGEKAVELLSRFLDQDMYANETILIEPTMIERGSVANILESPRKVIGNEFSSTDG